ncbi:MFS transporter [Glaciibacter sp. 2TAF33]|uniref:MFS transporter n=1 Tax=Glaciibacter sp. 2TAF33 TaxID=3233015 RepID=UPI003F92BAA0
MTAPASVRFAGLRDKPTRTYIGFGMLGMMGDNIEHVITYWVMWQMFHSPLLAGFAVVSHWLPHLFLSVWFGSLADRYDCRRIIQAAQATFMAVSVGWGVLFVTGTLQPWHCCVLLVLHGLASATWHPAEQMLLHDFASPDNLPSAVRLNSTGRSLGMLLGPLVGAVLLVTAGPDIGIFINVLAFVPMFLFMFVTRFTGHTRDGAAPRVRVAMRDAFSAVREVRSIPNLVMMIALAGATSLLIGVALAPLMPEFAARLGEGNAGFAYAALMGASAVGAVIGGVLLESARWFRPTVRVAIVATIVFAVATLAFALSGNYLFSLLMLFIGGIASLVSTSTEQTIVQLDAPAAIRGRVLGLYGMSSMGLRAGSGLTIGVLGTLIGVQWAVGLSALLLAVLAVAMLVYARTRRLAAAG